VFLEWGLAFLPLFQGERLIKRDAELQRFNGKCILPLRPFPLHLLEEGIHLQGRAVEEPGHYPPSEKAQFLQN
jgi:hypothetical protein